MCFICTTQWASPFIGIMGMKKVAEENNFLLLKDLQYSGRPANTIANLTLHQLLQRLAVQISFETTFAQTLQICLFNELFLFVQKLAEMSTIYFYFTYGKSKIFLGKKVRI